MNVTHHYGDLLPLTHAYTDGFPWMQIGVFPTTAHDEAYDWFNYTVGLGLAELWVPCHSIEGRGCGNQLVGQILNTFAAAWRSGELSLGDNVIVPLGIPGEDGEWERDADSIWWVAWQREPARKRGVNMTDADWCVPILWSSPLGWPE